jgi:hypothetical protein
VSNTKKTLLAGDDFQIELDSDEIEGVKEQSLN